ncbi:MAG TPA: N-acetylglucosamine kinase [Lacibacter sp.]|nr:N-acetylglucosamine kinase [Lacibacter sp.]HMO89772.1 N-acetylglucosamine kinase [Lacibacter sp.]HMP86680.1 N-acetylglucosamine kinase [Lacibacter sp.]
MAKTILIADSGATKAEWCLLKGKKRKIIFTQGISPYFMDRDSTAGMLLQELLPRIKKETIDIIWYYGTGCSNPVNARMIQQALKTVFPGAGQVKVDHDLMGAAKALCGHEPGVACILGTGSNSCFFNGKRIVKNSPGLGYILGDEGSGAYLGRKVIQHFLYNTFDGELLDKFNARFQTNRLEILDKVYRQPLPNRYMASFALFLSENRGHYMIENILEDSFNDFFFNHLYKYKESWKHPIHFVGGVAYAFRDVLKGLCTTYGLQAGTILKHPMEGLITYHRG